MKIFLFLSLLTLTSQIQSLVIEQISHQSITLGNECLLGKLIEQGQRAAVWGTANKWQAIGGTTLACYLGCYGYLFNKKRLLNKKDSWSNWKKDRNLTALLAIPQKELYVELKTAIAHHYKHTTHDELGAIILFISDTNTELQQAKRYVKLATTIQKFRLKLFFPGVTPTAISTIEEQINRLTLLRSIILNWQQHSTTAVSPNKNATERPQSL